MPNAKVGPDIGVDVVSDTRLNELIAHLEEPVIQPSKSDAEILSLLCELRDLRLKSEVQ